MSVAPPYIAEEWSSRPSVRLLNYVIVVLMIATAILGGTALDLLQIACELVLIGLLSFGILKVRRTGTDIILFATLVATSLASFLVNDIRAFALNFKLFLLCILTLTYFRKVRFLPHRLVSAVFVINALLIVHQYVTGHFILPAASFAGYYEAAVNTRPIGLFLTPHSSSFFIAIWLLYRVSATPLHALLSLALMAMTGGITNLVAVVAQMVDYLLRRSRAYRLSLGKIPLVTFIIAPLALIYFLIEPFLALMRMNSYFRYYAAEIILPQLFDARYFSEALRLIPTDYVYLTVMQEATYAQYGNEIGFIKVFVEAGLILGALTLWAIMREVRVYRVFFWVTLLHYSLVINTPFFLFLMIAYNREMMYPRGVPAGAARVPAGGFPPPPATSPVPSATVRSAT